MDWSKNDHTSPPGDTSALPVRQDTTMRAVKVGGVGLGAVALGAVALGAVALGAVAFGVLAVGTLAVEPRCAAVKTTNCGLGDLPWRNCGWSSRRRPRRD
jgi:hypothetical protein